MKNVNRRSCSISSTLIMIVCCYISFGITGNASSTSAGLGRVELVSVEVTCASSNPDTMLYDVPKSARRILKISFRSNIDLLKFAHTHNRTIGRRITFCDRGTDPIYINGSELYQSGINFERQTEALLLGKFPVPRAREVADTFLKDNQDRTHVYYVYIPLASTADPSLDYDLENMPEDVCFSLIASHLDFADGAPAWNDPIFSNTVRIPKIAIKNALHRIN